MITEKINNISKGQTFFTAEDGFSERFLADCFNKGIVLRELCVTPSSVNARTDSSNMTGINEAAYNSGMSVTIIKETGFPVLLSTIKNRFGIPLGLVGALIVYCMLSSVVWSVEINGCVNTDPESIRNVLDEAGVRSGAFIYCIDTPYIRRLIEASDDLIYRAAVDSAGCKIYVDIVENVPVEKIKGTDTYSNLVALRGGEIVKADIFAGEAEVKTGDSVVKGDLLVSGIKEAKDGKVILTDSEAKITARTSHVINCFVGDCPDVFFAEKRRDRWSFYLFGLYLLPESGTDGAKLTREEYFIKNSATVFPVGAVRQRETLMRPAKAELTDGQKMLIGVYDLAVNACRQVGGLKNISRKVNVGNNGQLTFEAEFICEEDIVSKQYFEVCGREIQD